MTPAQVWTLLPVTGLAWAAAAALTGAAARVGWLAWVACRHSGAGLLVRVRVPPEVDPRAAARLWANLSGLGQPAWRRWRSGQAHVVWEYAWSGTTLDIRLWTPDAQRAALAQRAIRAAWPGAICDVAGADTPLPRGGITSAGVVGLGGDTDALNSDLATEPLRGLLGAGDGAARHTSAIVQIYARPTAPHRVRAVRQTTTPGRGVRSMLLDLIDPTATGHRRVSGAERALRDRSRGPMFDVVVRYAAATTNTSDTVRARRAVRSRAGRLAAAMSVFTGSGAITRHRLRSSRPMTKRVMRPGAGKLCSIDEVAALAHLPADERMPQIDRAGAQTVAPVAAVASGGRNTKPLGTSAATGRKIAISAADARHHLHVVGATGTGKSTMLCHMVLRDIRERRGVVVVDPKGDLVNDVLDRLDPAEVVGRLRIIDPDQTRHVGLNPLAGDNPDLVTDHFVAICRSIWPTHWGPRADDILRSAVLTLLHADKPVLDALPTLLGNKRERSRITATLTGPLAGFWEWFDALPAGIQSQAIGPVLSRIRAQMTRTFVRDTIGNPVSDLDLASVLDGGVLLVRLPKGQIGDDSARLMGSVVVTRTWQAASARAALPETARRDAALYIDEAHNFLALPRSLDEVLAEARGYRLSLVLAHQHLAQMPKDLYAAISANARTKIFFHSSPEDAKLLARHTRPHLNEHDLTHLEAYTAACRVFTAATQQPAFTLATLPPAPVAGHAATVRTEAAPPAHTDAAVAAIPKAASGSRSRSGTDTSPPTSTLSAVAPQATSDAGGGR